MTTAVIEGNPFVGLRPFGSGDVERFFGSRKNVGELLELLHESRFVGVVGSSGCGKSSLILAGVIPALRAGFLTERRDQWLMATSRPGDQPLRNLARSLCANDGAPSEEAVDELLAAIDEHHTRALVDHIERSLDDRQNLLLLVDQFEELFAFRGADAETPGDAAPDALQRRRRAEAARRREEAATYADLLVELGKRRDLPVYVVLTMRTDFLGDCDLFYGLPEAMNRGRYLVPRLTRAQLRLVITGPVHMAGAAITPRLTDLLLNEIGDRTDRLPILQHALYRTWALWDQAGRNGPIDLEDYERAGTLDGALRDDAEQALGESDRRIVELAFRCLTDVDASERRVRRPARLAEIATSTGVSAAALRRALEPFAAEGRNFVFFSGSEDNPRIQISHESLIRQWPRLAAWVDQEHRDGERFMELVDDARDAAAGRGSLLAGPRLELFLEWQQTAGPREGWALRYCEREDDFATAIGFLEHSQAEAVASVARERARRRRWLAFLATLAAVSMAIAFWIYLLSAAAERSERRRSDLATLAAARSLVDARDFAEAGRTLARMQGEQPDEVDAQRAALIERIWARGLFAEVELEGRVADLAIGPGAAATGLRVLVRTEGGLVEVWSFSSGAAPSRQRIAERAVAASWGPNGQSVLTISEEGVATLNSIADGSVRASLENVDGAVVVPDGGESQLPQIAGLAVGPDVTRLFLGGPPKVSVDCERPCAELRASPDGEWLAATSAASRLQLWRLGGDRSPLEFTPRSGHGDAVVDARFSADGGHLATGSWDGSVWLWSLGDAARGIELAGAGPSAITCVAIRGDGQRVAAASEDRAVRVWQRDGTVWAPASTLEGHRAIVRALSFGHSGSLLTLDESDTARLWSDAGELIDRVDGVDAAGFGPGAQFFATAHEAPLDAARAGDAPRMILRVWQPGAAPTETDRSAPLVEAYANWVAAPGASGR